MDKKFRYILFGFTPDDATQIVVLKQADTSMQHQAFAILLSPIRQTFLIY